MSLPCQSEEGDYAMTEQNAPLQEGCWYHGGHPGLRPGDVIKPAKKIGASFRFGEDQAGYYDPSFVYLTRDLNMARNYAARYLTPTGTPETGDVYVVKPRDTVGLDPDFSIFPKVVGRCRRAKVVDVAERHVEASEDQLVRFMAPFLMVKGPDGDLVTFHDRDGQVTMTHDMSREEVSSEYLRLLKPWIDPKNLAATGAIVSQDGLSAAAFLEFFPSLDTGGHLISMSLHPLTRRLRRFSCSQCDQRFGPDAQGFYLAARHQIGEDELKLIMAHNPKLADQERAFVRATISSFVTGHESRWEWYHLATRASR